MVGKEGLETVRKIKEEKTIKERIAIARGSRVSGRSFGREVKTHGVG